MEKIGLGGGCHWCTEAVFQSLRGVTLVEQGWIATGDAPMSEAVVVHFEPLLIDLATLIEVHLHTHSSTAMHSMRGKYRSAVYVYSESQGQQAKAVLTQLQADFDKTIVTEVLPFGMFEANTPEYQNYYRKQPDKPFCQTFIHPKLNLIRQRFAQYANVDGSTHEKQTYD